MVPADDGSLRRQLGAEIRKLRLARGYTLREAAPRCGLSFQMLGQIEKDGQNTTLAKLETILVGLRGEVHLAPADGVSVAAEPEGPAYGIPEARRAIAARFLAVLPTIPEEELDVFLHQVALWERRDRRLNGG